MNRYPFSDQKRSLLRLLLLGVLLGCQGLAGCVSTKPFVYFQDDAGAAGPSALAAKYVPTIQPGDVLSVQVGSLNPEASQFFNPYAQFAVADRSGQPVAAMPTTPLPVVSGYLVDDAGTVDVPMLGKLKVQGRTVAEVKETIRDGLREYLKEPTVNVRNLNFRISVMGEVTRPGLFTIPNERITLLEALSLSGDATIYGRRDNVLIVREENGQRTFARLDLTKRDLFRSPYYQLHPNDVVYVEPVRAKAAMANRTNQMLPIGLSALSVVAVILTRIF